jgi:hypothetical protein
MSDMGGAFAASQFFHRQGAIVGVMTWAKGPHGRSQIYQADWHQT